MVKVPKVGMSTDDGQTRMIMSTKLRSPSQHSESSTMDSFQDGGQPTMHSEQSDYSQGMDGSYMNSDVNNYGPGPGDPQGMGGDNYGRMGDGLHSGQVPHYNAYNRGYNMGDGSAMPGAGDFPNHNTAYGQYPQSGNRTGFPGVPRSGMGQVRPGMGGPQGMGMMPSGFNPNQQRMMSGQSISQQAGPTPTLNQLLQTPNSGQRYPQNNFGEYGGGTPQKGNPDMGGSGGPYGMSPSWSQNQRGMGGYPHMPMSGAAPYRNQGSPMADANHQRHQAVSPNFTPQGGQYGGQSFPQTSQRYGSLPGQTRSSPGNMGSPNFSQQVPSHFNNQQNQMGFNQALPPNSQSQYMNQQQGSIQQQPQPPGQPPGSSPVPQQQTSLAPSPHSRPAPQPSPQQRPTPQPSPQQQPTPQPSPRLTPNPSPGPTQRPPPQASPGQQRSASQPSPQRSSSSQQSSPHSTGQVLSPSSQNALQQSSMSSSQHNHQSSPKESSSNWESLHKGKQDGKQDLREDIDHTMEVNCSAEDVKLDGAGGNTSNSALGLRPVPSPGSAGSRSNTPAAHSGSTAAGSPMPPRPPSQQVDGQSNPRMSQSPMPAPGYSQQMMPPPIGPNQMGYGPGNKMGGMGGGSQMGGPAGPGSPYTPYNSQYPQSGGNYPGRQPGGPGMGNYQQQNMYNGPSQMPGNPMYNNNNMGGAPMNRSNYNMFPGQQGNMMAMNSQYGNYGGHMGSTQMPQGPPGQTIGSPGPTVTPNGPPGSMNSMGQGGGGGGTNGQMNSPGPAPVKGAQAAAQAALIAAASSAGGRTQAANQVRPAMNVNPSQRMYAPQNMPSHGMPPQSMSPLNQMNQMNHSGYNSTMNNMNNMPNATNQPPQNSLSPVPNAMGHPGHMPSPGMPGNKVVNSYNTPGGEQPLPKTPKSSKSKSVSSSSSSNSVIPPGGMPSMQDKNSNSAVSPGPGTISSPLVPDANLSNSSIPSTQQLPSSAPPSKDLLPNSHPSFSSTMGPASTSDNKMVPPGTAPGESSSTSGAADLPKLASPGESSGMGPGEDGQTITTTANTTTVETTTTVTQSITSPVTSISTETGNSNDSQMEPISSVITPNCMPMPAMPVVPAVPASEEPPEKKKKEGAAQTPAHKVAPSPGGASVSSVHDDIDNMSSPGWPSTPKTNNADYVKLYEMGMEPDRRPFLDRLFQFLEEKGTPITGMPCISKQPLDLFRLYLCVREKGGMVEVTKAKKWKEICGLVNIGCSASAAFTLKKNYIKYMFAFECRYDRGGIDPAPILAQMEAQLQQKREAKQRNRAPSPAGSQGSQDAFRPPSVPNNNSQSQDSYPGMPGPNQYMQNNDPSMGHMGGPGGMMPNPMMQHGQPMMNPNSMGPGNSSGMPHHMGMSGPGGMGGPGPGPGQGMMNMPQGNMMGGNTGYMMPGGGAPGGMMGNSMGHQGGMMGPGMQGPNNLMGNMQQSGNMMGNNMPPQPSGMMGNMSGPSPNNMMGGNTMTPPNSMMGNSMTSPSNMMGGNTNNQSNPMLRNNSMNQSMGPAGAPMGAPNSAMRMSDSVSCQDPFADEPSSFPRQTPGSQQMPPFSSMNAQNAGMNPQTAGMNSHMSQMPPQSSTMPQPGSGMPPHSSAMNPQNSSMPANSSGMPAQSSNSMPPSSSAMPPQSSGMMMPGSGMPPNSSGMMPINSVQGPGVAPMSASMPPSSSVTGSGPGMPPQQGSPMPVNSSGMLPQTGAGSGMSGGDSSGVSSQSSGIPMSSSGTSPPSSCISMSQQNTGMSSYQNSDMPPQISKNNSITSAPIMSTGAMSSASSLTTMNQPPSNTPFPEAPGRMPMSGDGIGKPGDRTQPADSFGGSQYVSGTTTTPSSGRQFPFGDQFAKPERFDQSSPSLPQTNQPPQPFPQPSGPGMMNQPPDSNFPNRYTGMQMPPSGPEHYQQQNYPGGQAGYQQHKPMMGPNQYQGYPTPNQQSPFSKPQMRPDMMYNTPNKHYPDNRSDPYMSPAYGPRASMGFDERSGSMHYSARSFNSEYGVDDTHMMDRRSPMRQRYAPPYGPPGMGQGVPSMSPMQQMRMSPQRDRQFMSSAHKQKMSHGMSSGQFPHRKDMVFPPDSVEAIQPLLNKRRRLTKQDLGQIEAWRIMMALKSGLLAESTWALDTLNILLFDDLSIPYFSLSHLPGLLEVLLDHFRRCLIEMFNLLDETEFNSMGFKDDLKKLSVEALHRGEESTEIRLVPSTEKKEESDAPNDKAKNGMPFQNFTMVTRQGKEVVLEEDADPNGLLDSKAWDVYCNFGNLGVLWSLGKADMTEHIKTHFGDQKEQETFCRKFFRKPTNLKQEEASDSCDQATTGEEHTEVEHVVPMDTEDSDGKPVEVKREDPSIELCDRVTEKSHSNDKSDVCSDNCDSRSGKEEGQVEEMDTDSDKADSALEKSDSGSVKSECGEKCSFEKDHSCNDFIASENIKTEPRDPEHDRTDSSDSFGDVKAKIKLESIFPDDQPRVKSAVKYEMLDNDELVRHCRNSFGINTDGERSNVEDEAYQRNEPPLCLTEEYRSEIGRRCVCISNIFRSLSCIPGNDTEMSKYAGLIYVLGKLLLLHHKHLPRSRVRRKFDRDDVDEDMVDTTQGAEEWWWEFLSVLRENTFVIFANICAQLRLDLYPDEICKPTLEGLLHWAVCPSACATDPLPTTSPTSVLSPLRLVLEAMCKLCIHQKNVDMLLATPPYERIVQLFGVLTKLLANRTEQVTVEFSIVLLSELVQGGSSAARGVALQQPSISLLIDFLETAEQKAMQVVNVHGINMLRESPEMMGTSLDMLRRAATVLLHLAQVPVNRKMFIHHQSRLLSLVMSQILDQTVAQILSDVLFQCSEVSPS